MVANPIFLEPRRQVYLLLTSLVQGCLSTERQRRTKDFLLFCVISVTVFLKRHEAGSIEKIATSQLHLKALAAYCARVARTVLSLGKCIPVHGEDECCANSTKGKFKSKTRRQNSRSGSFRL